MKLLVFGRDIVIQRIKAVLYNSGIEANPVSWEKLKNQDTLTGYDIAIIDMAFDNAENACRLINKTYEIPLVLIVKHNQADWAYLDSLKAFGYISDTFSKSELIARLSTIFRRYHTQRDLSETFQAS